MAERGISVDHATIHRWIVRYSPELLEQLQSPQASRQLANGTWTRLISKSEASGDISIAPSTAMVTRSSSGSASGATSLPPSGSCARPSSGMAGPSGSSSTAARPTARRSCPAIRQTGFEDRSRRKLKPIRIRQSAYLNNRIEQDHRAIKRRVRPMLGFKSMSTARAILGGIEMVHMMRKQTGEVRLQSAAIARRAVQSARRLSLRGDLSYLRASAANLRRNRRTRSPHRRARSVRHPRCQNSSGPR